MKKPRLTDFDPNAKAPALSSPLDDMPAIQKSPARQEIVQDVIKEKNEPTNERTLKRTNVRSLLDERRKIRHTFDIFSDQLTSLREVSLNREKIFGKRVLLGDLIQEALDMFITKERNKE